MNKFVTTLLLYQLASGLLQAFPTQSIESFGLLGLSANGKNQLDSEMSIAGVDGRSTIVPPTSTTLDRRIDTQARVNGAFMVAPQLAVFSSFAFLNSYQKAQEKTGALNPSITKSSEIRPSVDLKIAGNRGLNFVGGLCSRYLFADSVSSTNAGVASQAHSENILLVSPRIALLKNADSWGAALYFIKDSEKERHFNKEIPGIDTISGSTKASIPAEYGISGIFSYGLLNFGLDLASVLAGESGPTNAAGKNLNADYLRTIFTISAPINQGVIAELALAHQTLSYADSSFTNLDNIPVSSLHAAAKFGSPGSQFSIGLLLGFGNEEASITEFNREFKMTALGLSTGFSGTQ